MLIMTYILVNAVGIAVAALAYSAGRWAHHRGRPIVIGLLTAACLLIVVKSALYQVPVLEAALFPFAWYVWLQDSWVVYLGVLFLGLVIPQLPEAANRRSLMLLMAMILIMGGQRTWWIVRPEIHGKAIVPDAEHHLAQSTLHTCAPCACAIALSYVGVVQSERRMAELCLTRENGTTAFNTYRGLLLALNGTPWTVRMRHLDVDDLVRSGQVAVVDFPKIRHALTLRGTGDAFIVHDPLDIVPQDRSRDWVAKQYGGTALVIVPR